MFPISLVTIAKNEEDVIELLFKSVKHIVSEMIVIDTGSTDNTVEIAMKYGCIVYIHKWQENFAEAKNFGIEKATNEWILVLDADERIELVNDIELKQMLLEEKIVWSLKSFHEFNRGSDVLEQIVYQPRLFRNIPAFRYHERIHEELRYNNEPIQTRRTDNLVFRHIGYLKERIQKKNKIDRNVKLHIMESMKEPENPRHFFRAAKTCFNAHDYKQAKSLYEKAMKLDIPTKEMFASILIDYSYCCNDLGEYDLALSLLLNNIEFIETYVDVWYVLGLLFLAKKQVNLLTDALNCFDKCLTIGEVETNFEHTIGTGSFLPAYNMGLIYETLGDPKAEKYYKISADFGYQNAKLRIDKNICYRS